MSDALNDAEKRLREKYLEKLRNACKENVSDGTYRGHRCTRKSVRDGYCRQHHPDEAAARRKARREKWDAEERRRQLARAKATRDAKARLRRTELLEELRSAVGAYIDEHKRAAAEFVAMSPHALERIEACLAAIGDHEAGEKKTVPTLIEIQITTKGEL